MSDKKRDDSYFAAGRRKKKRMMMIVVPVVIVIAAAAGIAAMSYRAPQAMAISGIECNVSEQLSNHYHSHLFVLVDGEQQQIPANIGVSTSPHCFYWLHTHSSDGVIHIESPRTENFTVGQFLDIWKQQGSNGNSFFSSVASKPVTLFVNGTEAQGDYRSTVLESRQQLVLAYGSRPVEIPTYDFGALK